MNIIKSNIKSLNELIKLNVEGESIFKINGTVNNINFSNNTTYFTIHDNNFSLNGIIWNNNYIEQKNALLIDNTEYEFEGKINYYTKNGRMNFVVTNYVLVKIKENKLLILRQKFETEGILKIQKKEITKNINVIGIITSINGAAMNDILAVFKKNNFKGMVIIKNCSVQGKKSAQSVIDSIDWFYKNNYVDVLIITRGGGAETDLESYSDEELCRKVSTCKYTTISAIGHERDVVLMDYTCDIRASTPTMAGELVTKQYASYDKDISVIENRLDILKNKIFKNINIYRKTNERIKKNMKDPEDEIKLMIDKINTIKNNVLRNILFYRSKAEKYNKPKIMNIQGKIFPLTYLKCGGKIITSLKDYNEHIKKGNKIKICFTDGETTI